MDRPTRVRALGLALLVVLGAFVLQAATASPGQSGVTRTADGAYPGETLVTVQSFGGFEANNGEAFIVDEAGEVVWRYDPTDSRVFDGEQLENGNLLFAVARAVPNADCPAEFQDTDRFPGHCVQNRVVELDRETKAVVWEYAWYDAFIHWHEVHDVDRLPGGGTAVVDMGNDRAFVVDGSGTVTWSWDAAEHLGPGSDFWAQHVPSDRQDAYRPGGPEGDWTHMNDVDATADGSLQLSIRNLDVVVEVDPETDAIVSVVGAPGEYDVMREQHDPHRLEAAGTLLVADSKNNRVVELDVETGEPVWSFTGESVRLQWPRDADRLPNGNTLVVDSRNFRVLEVNASGGVVWEYSLSDRVGIVYDADRLSVPEEPGDAPGGRSLSGGDGPGDGFVAYLLSWAPFVFPPWVGAAELVTLLAGLVLAGWLGVEGALEWRSRRRQS